MPRSKVTLRLEAQFQAEEEHSLLKSEHSVGEEQDEKSMA
jgi:hypothetical protein